MTDHDPLLRPLLSSDVSDESDDVPLQVSSSDESDNAWLVSLCRTTPRALHPTPSDESDNAWLVSLCRTSLPTDSNSSTSGVSLPGPWTSLDELSAELLAAGCPDIPRRSLPEQDALQVSVDQHSSWPPVRKCLWQFAAWGKSLGVFIFKIGIAYDPPVRWEQYADEERWLFMDVMHEGKPEECRCLEKNLIGKLRHIPGCYNVAPGGEGIRAGVMEGKCFCYAVYATAGEGISLREAWRARKRRLQGHA